MPAALPLFTTELPAFSLTDSLNSLINLINNNFPQVIAAGTFVANGASNVTVNTTASALIGVNDVVVFGLNTIGGTVGAVPAVKTVTPGTGFAVAATASDTSTYNWKILRF